MKNFITKKSMNPLPVFKKIGAIALLSFFGLWIDGCNDCNVNEKIDTTPGDVVFSAIPLNMDRYSVFTVKKDGNDLKEHIDNSKVFTRPDKNGRILYVEEDHEGQKNIYISDIPGKDKTKVISGKFYPEVNIPVLSPEGSFFSFYGGDGRLLFSSIGQGMPDIISDAYDAGFIPAFSFDGQYLAYMESSNDSLIFKVINTDNLEVVFSKKYPELMPENNYYHIISPNHQNDKVIFSIALSNELCNIGIFDFRELELSEYEIEGTNLFNPVIRTNSGEIFITGSDGNIWLAELDGNISIPEKLTDVASDQICTYVNHRLEDDLILYTQFSKSGYSGGILKVLNVEYKEEIILSSQVFRGFWLDEEKK